MQKETLELLEESVQDSLKNVIRGTDDKERSSETKRSCDLLDRLIAAEHEQSEFWNEQEQREFDREKLETTSEIDRERVRVEQEKNDVPTWKAVAEIAKVVVPIGVAIGNYLAYNKFQKRMLEFEENGRICSTAGRELHLPKFW